MSKIPNIKRTKYNNSAPYTWVDSQWENFMIEQKELKTEVKKLTELIHRVKWENKSIMEMFNRAQFENTKLRNKLIELGENPNQLNLFKE